ncbi:4-hydroxy-4-methyl-2-oxoglutarate aldolase/4-carboxy-4-hydroxy-2-oxoadipate aldolase [Peribacillus frigoritolerans]|nr:4-hydroxy-4-methyl-2-oxoglutarate aldolase/4-carboxy-4-hydroxy-2-oxoadipate aldolase [Peribacillus frigoritolerans]
MAGRALTVKIPVGDNSAVLKAIGEAKPGDIIVVDSKGDTYRAIAGDFVVGMMQTMEIGGLVVDGVIRDLEAIKELNFPVFSKGTTVASSGKAGVGETNVPISCGGVTVYPGDIIIGDIDGVVVVPKDKGKEILVKAKDKIMKDEQRAEKYAGKPDEIRKYIAMMTNKG